MSTDFICTNDDLGVIETGWGTGLRLVGFFVGIPVGFFVGLIDGRLDGLNVIGDALMGLPVIGIPVVGLPVMGLLVMGCMEGVLDGNLLGFWVGF